ncbi:Murein hydrolase activator NlpD [Vibrio marisflavi CECT 7928]|uniref:Murein hydrolase activator NlpD n=1 Tax=Vibrio marisflavi CECT 7928 TaxID=634439 RepID=A0ABM9A2F7_9VIBR|nr:Murein hydrolase activator NlpD [Vibrio marisflavi CECT 7928]
MLVACTARTPAPVSGLHKDYGSITRSSYRGSYYEVKKGDTLYFISYITGKDVKDIIRYNNLKKPYTIHPGQKLDLWRPAYVAPSYGGAGTGKYTTPTSSAISSASKKNQQVISDSVPKNQQTDKKYSKNRLDQSKTKEYVESKGKQNVKKSINETSPPNKKISRWLWPTKGRIIKSYSAGDHGNKGIDIAGRRGQSIVSTAGGTVVYSGNALRGYGNLVIVKHNDNYLSAYAHNERLLVHEGQSVKAGQKIATMGSSGSSSVRLHFEIRYQGKSVNPNRYLP